MVKRNSYKISRYEQMAVLLPAYNNTEYLNFWYVNLTITGKFPLALCRVWIRFLDDSCSNICSNNIRIWLIHIKVILNPFTPGTVDNRMRQQHHSWCTKHLQQYVSPSILDGKSIHQQCSKGPPVMSPSCLVLVKEEKLKAKIPSTIEWKQKPVN